MPLKPMREEEKKVRLKRIAEVRNEVTQRLAYLYDLERELEEEVWESGPVDPIRAAAARERLAKIEQGKSPEHFKEFRIGNKVKHIFYSDAGTVVRVDDFTLASEGCLPFGPTILVRLDGIQQAACFKPEYLEIVAVEHRTEEELAESEAVIGPDKEGER